MHQNANSNITQVLVKHFNSWGFQGFKYLVYTLLAFNVYLFFKEEWLASKIIFAGGVTLDHLIEAFASTLDTAAWLVLLLLFELETYVLDDDKIKGVTKWTINILGALCYLVIIYAFYGYLTKVGLLAKFTPYQIKDLCTLSSDWTFMISNNIYQSITKESCAAYTAASESYFAYANGNHNIVTSAAKLFDVKLLAWVDVINSAAWLSVVVMLEVEVHMQLGHFNSKIWHQYNLHIKAFVYGVLLLAAIFWGVTGNFIEFWDAFLWLVAFALIEMNMFEWQAETAIKKQQKDKL